MPFIIILVVAIAVFALIAYGKPSQSGRPSLRKASSRIANGKKVVFMGSPKLGLGLRAGVPLHGVASRLDRAFEESEFAKRIKFRVLQRYSNITSAEYDWYFLELKRFFVVAAIMKKAPMFSPRVDEIWHEMLMFTREYQQFCERYIGFQLHHEPHADEKPPENRAWFDWVYAQLFLPTPYSSHIWEGFFRSPLGNDFVLELERMDAEELKSRLFNERGDSTDEEVQQTVDWLAIEVKRQLKQAIDDNTAAMNNRPHSTMGNLGTAPITDFTGIAGAMMLFSIMKPDEYGQQMAQMLEAHKQATVTQSDEAALASSVFGDTNIQPFSSSHNDVRVEGESSVAGESPKDGGSFDASGSFNDNSYDSGGSGSGETGGSN